MRRVKRRAEAPRFRSGIGSPSGARRSPPRRAAADPRCRLRDKMGGLPRGGPRMPQTIGRYLVTGTLGEGGMGVVYSAYDDRLGRPIAIKMIKKAASDPSARQRLAREARAAASVNHPAICQLYEIGEDEG